MGTKPKRRKHEIPNIHSTTIMVVGSGGDRELENLVDNLYRYPGAISFRTCPLTVRELSM